MEREERRMPEGFARLWREFEARHADDSEQKVSF
jgi:hypothetical protein